LVDGIPEVTNPAVITLIDDEVTQGSSQLIAGYPGSFMYDLQAAFISSDDSVTLNSPIDQGSNQTIIQVSTLPSDWPATGSLIFNFGLGDQEGPVKYNAVIGSDTLLIDPSHTFQNTYLTGSTVRLVRQSGPYTPRTNGQDYAVYNTSTAPARDQVETWIRQIVAAGIIIQFQITVPDEKWAVLPNLYSVDPLSTTL
jgi:hypothetical protein